MSDSIDQAIDQATRPPEVEMIEYQRQMAPTGRPCVVVVPADITFQECCALVQFVSTLAFQRQAEQAKRSQIVEVRSMPAGLTRP